MPKQISKPPLVQKPFRCSSTLEIQMNKVKGALMLKTGERISDNQFMINILELGLEKIKEKMNLNIVDSH